MRIKRSELSLGYSGFRLAREQGMRSGGTTSDSPGREMGKDRVSLSFAGRSRASSRKLSGMLTQSSVKDGSGRKYQFSNGALEVGIREKGRKSDWQLGISNIRGSGGRTAVATASHTSYEKERMAFSGIGNVTLADGRQVEFSLEMLMQREFELQEHDALSTSTVRLLDPLVINFSGNTPKLTDTKFQFDLNADGLYENISFIGPGSGFLALDSNKDGLVNDGRELFGPNTGNGFSELQAFDKDGNQWIDENDPIYEELKIWTKDGSGQDRLQSLKELGVGAISLASAATPFSITNHHNEVQGQVGRSSVMMQEDGSVHTVQQIDLMAKETGVAVAPPEPVTTQGVVIVGQDLFRVNTDDHLRKNELEIYRQQVSRDDGIARQTGDLDLQGVVLLR